MYYIYICILLEIFKICTFFKWKLLVMLYQVVQSYFFLIVVADLKGLFTNKCMMYTNITLVSFGLSYRKGSDAIHKITSLMLIPQYTLSVILVEIVQSFTKLPKISHPWKLRIPWLHIEKAAHVKHWFQKCCTFSINPHF